MALWGLPAEAGTADLAASTAATSTPDAVGAQEREDGLYGVLGIDRSASSEQVREAYFDLALQNHPDLAGPGEAATAGEKFEHLARAFWVLSDPERRARYNASGEAQVADCTCDAVQQVLLRDCVFEGEREIEELVAEQLQCRTPEEYELRFLEAHFAPAGPILGERLRCKLCGFQARGRGKGFKHLSSTHGLEPSAWASEALRDAKASFLSFMSAVSSNSIGSQPSPQVPASVISDLERSLEGPEALEEALEGSPVEVREVLERLRLLNPGIAAYLLPVEDAELSLELPAVWEKPERQAGEVICTCGFTCGTWPAFERHLARFRGEAGHRALT